MNDEAQVSFDHRKRKLDKYICQFLTNTFVNFDKYILYDDEIFQATGGEVLEEILLCFFSSSVGPHQVSEEVNLM